jgi:hypothetical protein
MVVRDSERVCENPGNVCCKTCGGLILDPVIIRYGCNVRHAKDRCLPRESQPKGHGVKVITRSARSRGTRKYLAED